VPPGCPVGTPFIVRQGDASGGQRGLVPFKIPKKIAPRLDWGGNHLTTVWESRGRSPLAAGGVLPYPPLPLHSLNTLMSAPSTPTMVSPSKIGVEMVRQYSPEAWDT
jgi:hypothetical protein